MISEHRSLRALRDDTRGLTSAEWLVIAFILLGGVMLVADRLHSGVSSEGDAAARAIETGEGAGKSPSVGASAPSIGASAPAPPSPSLWDEFRFGTAAILSGGNLYQFRLLASLADGNPRPILDFIQGAILGGFIENPNFDQAAGDVVFSTSFGMVGLGEPMDLRDLTAALIHYAQGHPGSGSEVAIAAIAFIPDLGDGLRGYERLAHAGEIMGRPLVRNGVTAIGIADGVSDVVEGAGNEPPSDDP